MPTPPPASRIVVLVVLAAARIRALIHRDQLADAGWLEDAFV
jgi:hypothetical protein